MLAVSCSLKLGIYGTAIEAATSAGVDDDHLIFDGLQSTKTIWLNLTIAVVGSWVILCK